MDNSMDSLFPFVAEEIDDNVQDIDTVLAEPREYGWDFQKNDFVVKNGKPMVVTGNEAIKVWAYKALKTDRDRYFIYSDDYGSELKSLMEQGTSGELLEQEVKRILEECLLVSPYINSITDMEIDRAHDYVNISCVLNTDYGEVTVTNV